MRKVTIYTTNYCGFCRRAKAILKQQSVPFDEINVEDDDEKREWLQRVTGQHTVPQIFFDDEAIGGCMDLEELIRKGTLDEKVGKVA
jgi:glutaredoxin 3